MPDINVLSNDSQTDIFFRAVDRLQLESFLGALSQDHKSLAIISPYTELLQYYGDVVIRRLHKKFPNVPMEIFVADDTDAILERFNVILNDLSFDEATKARQLNQPEKILVIQEAKKLDTRHLELLVQLIQNFPGAGICALLLLESSAPQSSNIFRDNSRFITWTPELPTQEQKQNLFDAAKKVGQEDMVSNFFAQLSHAEKRNVQQSNTNASAIQVANTSGIKAKDKETKDTKPTAIWPKLIIGFGLLAITLGVTVVLHPETGASLLTVFKLQSKAPIVETMTPPKVSPPDTLEPEVVMTELPEQATQGLNWLLNLHPDQYVLEYKTFEKISEAQTYLKSKASLKRAYIVPVFLENQPYSHFMVVDGPYPTAEAAKIAASRSSMLSDITIEKISSLIEFIDLKKQKHLDVSKPA